MYFYPHFARKCYNKSGVYIPVWRRYQRMYHDANISPSDCNMTNFGQYSPAYATTNENWRFAMNKLHPAGKSVLTVTASGDQPIAFAISGAQNIDTFDTTYFAKVVMDIKTSAIQTLNHKQYGNMVDALRNTNCVSEIPGYDKIAPLCPHDTIIATKQMRGCYIFNQGTGPNTEYMPTESEYNIARKTIKTPMNFIWSDLQDLNTQLNKQYDIIYLSNIFDYFQSSQNIINTINKMHPFVKDGGEIMLYLSCVHDNVSEIVSAAAMNCGWGDVKSHVAQNTAMLTMTRTR